MGEQVLFYARCVNTGIINGLKGDKHLKEGKIYPIVNIVDEFWYLHSSCRVGCGGYFFKRFKRIADNEVFNVGDWVTVRKDLIIGKRYLRDVLFNGDMKRFCGIKVEIKEITDYGYKLSNYRFTFSSDMIEEYVNPVYKEEEEKKMYKDNSGQYIEDLPENVAVSDSNVNGTLKVTTTKTLILPNVINLSINGEMPLHIPKDKFIKIIQILNKSNIIDAVRLWKHIFDLSLAESKQSVDYILENM